MWKVKCGMETIWKLWKDGVEWWVKCVMRKFSYVGDRLCVVNSCEWACCTLVHICDLRVTGIF